MLNKCKQVLCMYAVFLGPPLNHCASRPFVGSTARIEAMFAEEERREEVKVPVQAALSCLEDFCIRPSLCLKVNGRFAYILLDPFWAVSYPFQFCFSNEMNFGGGVDLGCDGVRVNDLKEFLEILWSKKDGITWTYKDPRKNREFCFYTTYREEYYIEASSLLAGAKASKHLETHEEGVEGSSPGTNSPEETKESPTKRLEGLMLLFMQELESIRSRMKEPER